MPSVTYKTRSVEFTGTSSTKNPVRQKYSGSASIVSLKTGNSWSKALRFYLFIMRHTYLCTRRTKAWTSWMMGSWPSWLPLDPGGGCLDWAEAGDDGEPLRKWRDRLERSVLWGWWEILSNLFLTVNTHFLQPQGVQEIKSWDMFNQPLSRVATQVFQAQCTLPAKPSQLIWWWSNEPNRFMLKSWDLHPFNILCW